MVVAKGGVWTNIEDEVLKASVSKYGLQQWARVSSLLARKTPKQCKARWYEWLDPSIKKIEWSREEDEKLLHLAKLLPTQWRTIAPHIGRTANQCLERYQKLLDEAEQKEAAGLGLAGPDGGETQAPSADDVRRLRPGEVDPDPESKPARPDTVDLDEDEKEMLSEARARLANTQGKKAKRKARERQQEESRRLGSLSKRRELKAAGINIKVVTRKKGQMDYNADIPFEKKPVPGFYDTSEEQVQNERERAAFDPRKHQLTAGKRKGDDEEDGERKRRKGDKEDNIRKEAMKAGQMQKIREAEQSSKRRELVLPAPQVGEGELEEIVKMGMIGERANTMARESDNDATRGLLGNYSALNTGAPVRTPRAPAQEDHIANEIRNIRALTETQSSLLGGDNTPLHEGAASTGFESVAPRRQVVATPNPMATPLRSGAVDGLATPLRPGQTPMRTPRDNFALNRGDNELGLPNGTIADLKMREMAMKHQLKQGLANLPKPKETEWDLELPEEQAEVKTAESLREDAADRDRRERERREAAAALERKRRTQVMQRGLPRPGAVDINKLLKEAASMSDPAEALIAREAAILMEHDSQKFPIPGSMASRQIPKPLQQMPDDALNSARREILAEAKSQVDPDAVQAACGHSHDQALLLGLGCYVDDDEEEQVATMRSAFNTVQDTLIASAEKGAKLEKKLALHLGGYQKRAETLRKKTVETSEALAKANHAFTGLSILATSEDAARERRLAALREEVSHISRREREAQELYKANKEELDELMADSRRLHHSLKAKKHAGNDARKEVDSDADSDLRSVDVDIKTQRPVYIKIPRTGPRIRVSALDVATYDLGFWTGETTVADGMKWSLTIGTSTPPMKRPDSQR